ncbi:MAG: hypothetical protein QXR62_05765 [Candidatus Bathyarchaeia archaeon]
MLDVLVQFLQNPIAYIILLIEFILGFCLGYLSIKVLKYILALIAVLVVGVFLNVWSLGLSLDRIVGMLGEYSVRAKDLLMGLAGTLGLLTLGPVTLGFLIGVIVAAARG